MKGNRSFSYLIRIYKFWTNKKKPNALNHMPYFFPIPYIRCPFFKKQTS